MARRRWAKAGPGAWPRCLPPASGLEHRRARPRPSLLRGAAGRGRCARRWSAALLARRAPKRLRSFLPPGGGARRKRGPDAVAHAADSEVPVSPSEVRVSGEARGEGRAEHGAPPQASCRLRAGAVFRRVRRIRSGSGRGSCSQARLLLSRRTGPQGDAGAVFAALFSGKHPPVKAHAEGLRLQARTAPSLCFSNQR